MAKKRSETGHDYAAHQAVEGGTNSCTDGRTRLDPFMRKGPTWLQTVQDEHAQHQGLAIGGVEEVPAPVEEVPAPVEEVPAAVEEEAAAVEEVPTAVEEVPAAVEEVPAMTDWRERLAAGREAKRKRKRSTDCFEEWRASR